MPIQNEELRNKLTGLFERPTCFVVVHDLVPVLTRFLEFGLNPPLRGHVIDLQAVGASPASYIRFCGAPSLDELTADVRDTKHLREKLAAAPCAPERLFSAQTLDSSSITTVIDEEFRNEQLSPVQGFASRHGWFAP
jgi:hypothetical protein